MMRKPIIPGGSSLHANIGNRWHILGNRILLSNRYSLIIAISLAIIIPEIIHNFVLGGGRLFDRGPSGCGSSLIGALISLLASHLSLRNLGNLPLVTYKVIIIPTFLVSYSIVIVTLISLRIPIDPFHFWTSFVGSIGVYVGLSMLRVRKVRPVIGLVGLQPGFHGDLPDTIRWLTLAEPRLHRPVNAVVVDPHTKLDVDWSRFLTELVLSGMPVYHRGHLEEGLTGRVVFRNYAENNFGALLPSSDYARLKRIIDLISLLILSPFIICIIMLAAVAIRIEGRGPIFYRQMRRGFRGRQFKCYKLRTMSAVVSGPSYTRTNDERITRTGSFLRKWRVDELPQALNILRGEMSWIGPRPEALELASMYEREVPFYDYRHAVMPGISGWAAVHQGNVALTEATKLKLEYDFYYIKYFSFWLDFLILIKTVQTIFSGFGSK